MSQSPVFAGDRSNRVIYCGKLSRRGAGVMQLEAIPKQLLSC